MRIEIDSRLEVRDVQKMASAVGCIVRALPDGSLAIIKTKPTNIEVTSCQLTPKSAS